MKLWMYVLAMPVAAFVVGVTFELGRVVAHRATAPSLEARAYEACRISLASDMDTLGGSEWCDRMLGGG